MHDRQRKLAGGRPTFDRIWSNLLALRGVEGVFEVLVRIHVDAENVAAIPRFLEQVFEEFGSDPRFTPRLKPLQRFGGPNDGQLEVLLGRECERTLTRLRRIAEAGRPRPSAAEPVAEACYAAKGNSFIVRADGRLSKCTVALSHPRNDVGRIHEDGRVEIDAPAIEGWMRGLWSGKQGELLCPMIGLAEPERPSVGEPEPSGTKIPRGSAATVGGRTR